FLGVQRKQFAMTLAPHTSRILSIRKLTGVPQVIGSDMHLLQGYHELTKLKWDEASGTLCGQCRRAAGLSGQLIMYVPTPYEPKFDFPLRDESAHLTHLSGAVWAREISFDRDVVDWSVPFTKRK